MKMGRKKKDKNSDKQGPITPETIRQEEQDLKMQMTVINSSLNFWGTRLESVLSKLKQIPANDWDYEEEREKLEKEMVNLLWRMEKIENPLAEKYNKKIEKFNEKKAQSLFSNLAKRLREQDEPPK